MGKQSSSLASLKEETQRGRLAPLRPFPQAHSSVQPFPPVTRRKEEAPHLDISERWLGIVDIAMGPMLQMRKAPIPTCVSMLLSSLL